LVRFSDRTDKRSRGVCNQVERIFFSECLFHQAGDGFVFSRDRELQFKLSVQKVRLIEIAGITRRKTEKKQFFRIDFFMIEGNLLHAAPPGIKP
jgi:hypothetical protein